jgi:hypothetical protein
MPCVDWWDNDVFCGTRVERMRSELGGIIHGMSSRLAPACLAPRRNHRPVSGPKLTKVTERCRITFGIRA